MLDRPSTPRPPGEYRRNAAAGAAALILAVGIVVVAKGWEPSPKRDLVLYIAIALSTLAATFLVLGYRSWVAWSSSRPVSGKVIDRFIEFSAFVDDDIPTGASLGDVLKGKASNLVESKRRYWLQIKDESGRNHWVVVPEGIFLKHPERSMFDKANPERKPGASTAVTPTQVIPKVTGSGGQPTGSKAK